ncbi:MAG: right-handed parallel beta-helix repeat-containing protein [Phycisphaerae bacterium]|nr:right-handed parallel beta-helix repeat-containing protein [Phycisphaerae bacterium]
MTRRTLLSAMLLCLTAPALATDYYVAPDGDDANPGTLEKPFKSPIKAAAKLVAGDTLFFRAGQYVCKTTGTVGLAPSADGTADKPITFRNYKDEHVQIDGAGSDWGVTPNGYSYIVFDGLDITNKTHYGMKISAASGRRTADGKPLLGHHITIRNCEVHHTGMETIFSFGTEYLTIENCHLHDSGGSHGLYLQVGCHNAVVRNVTSEDNHGNSGMQLNAAGGGIRNALVENCLLRNNAQGFSLMGAQDCVFRGNVVYNDCVDGPRGSGYREVIEWTYGDKSKGDEGTPCKNVLFEHNTFVNTRPDKINNVVEIKSKSSGATFRNNIFLIAAKRQVFTVAEDSAAGLTMTGNLFSSPLDYQVAYGKDGKLKVDDFLKQIGSPGKNAIGDPMLAAPEKGDFSPKAGSPALGAATPSTQPDNPAAKWSDIGAVQKDKPRQIGCTLPWKKAAGK